MRALLFSIALIIMSALPALALDVLIVQSSNGPAYAESIRGFREAYNGTTQTILLSDYAEVDLVRLVKEEQPRLVLAVGEPAFAKAKKIRQLPVVALMALSYNLNRPSSSNIHGVSLVASPASYMELFSGMGAKRVGVLFNPARTGQYLKRAQKAAVTNGIKLVAVEIHDSRDVVTTIEKLHEAVDLLWMLPDSTAVTSATLEAYFSFSVDNKVPVVAFSEQYLSKGATASIDIDPRDMGRQAGELVSLVLKTGERAVGTPLDPRNLKINHNSSIAQRLGLKIPQLGKNGN